MLIEVDPNTVVLRREVARRVDAIRANLDRLANVDPGDGLGEVAGSEGL